MSSAARCRGPSASPDSKGRARDQRGFTLTEIVITLLIVAILGALAASAYVREARKSRRQDALNALAVIANAQEQYFMNRQVNPAARTYTTIVNELGLGFPTVDGTLRSRQGHYALTVAACPGSGINDCFVATASAVAGGAQAGDTDCLTITLDSRGRRTPAIGGCW